MMKKIYLTGYKNINLGDDLFFIKVLNRYKDLFFLFEDTPSGFYSELFRDFSNIEVLPFVNNNMSGRVLNMINRKINRFWAGQFYTTYQKKNKIKADAFLKIGGSIFIEPNKSLESIKWRYLAEKKYFGDIPFFYIGCNFGPFSSPSYYDCSEYVIKSCNSICFRDTYSYNLFKHIEHVKVAPDVLFGIKDVCGGLEKKPNSLGVSLINLSGRPSLEKYYHSYLESISSFILSQQNNYDLIRLFSFCEPEGDEQAIRDLVTLLPGGFKRKIDIVTYNGNYIDFLLKISEMESLISTRFHAMILGFVYGIKTIPIVYSKKITHVLDDLNCEISPVFLSSISRASLEKSFLESKLVNVDYQIHNSQKQFKDFDNYVYS